MDGNTEKGRIRRGRGRRIVLSSALALVGLTLTASAAFGGFDGLARAVRDHVYCKVVRDCAYDAPNTKIVKGPKGLVRDARPSFGFSSDERHVSYRCRIDSAPFESCSNPYTTDELRNAKHVLRVAAVDSDGLTDPTPAKRTFVVDTRHHGHNGHHGHHGLGHGHGHNDGHGHNGHGHGHGHNNGHGHQHGHGHGHGNGHGHGHGHQHG
jgi:hypothetical protein